MSGNKRLIQGTYSTRRYLHSDEIFCKERNWNIDLPFEREFKNGYAIVTDKNDTAYSIDELVELLNEFQKEIKGFESCSHNWGILYNEAINKVEELSKENKELKGENKQLKQQFKYIQNSISEHIKHQKTELGHKALQEIIKDYNEWLLGHKELKE